MTTTSHSTEPDEQPLASWLYNDPEEMPPPELRAIYGKLDLAVTKVCEQARKSMRDGYIAALRQVRDALAPSGLFKDWCEAAGLSYNTAKSVLARADAARPLPEQAAGNALHTPSAASVGGARASGGKRKTHTITVTFESDVELAETKERLRDVELRTTDRPADNWRAALLYLLDYFEQRDEREGTREPANTPEAVGRRLHALVEAEPTVESEVAAQPEVVDTVAVQQDVDNARATDAQPAAHGAPTSDVDAMYQELKNALEDVAVVNDAEPKAKRGARQAAKQATATAPAALPPAGATTTSEEGARV